MASGSLLVVAAAGYGKTTALEAACADGQTAYVTASDLLGGAAVGGTVGHVAVDDACRLDPPRQVRLARLLAAFPGHVRVSVASRHPLDPAAVAELPGPVTERGPADLALTPDALFRVLREEHGLADADLAYHVHHLTAGWPALTHLAGDVLRRGAGRHDLLPALVEAATTWVREEVLAGLPAWLLDLVADLDPITEPLCAAVMAATSDGPEWTPGELRPLARTGLLVANGLGAPRLVPVLRAVLLRDRHLRTAAEGLPGRLRTAAAWYQRHGYAVAAARAFQGAGDAGACAALVESGGDGMLAAGGAAEVVRLIDELPATARTPRVRLIRADALRMAGRALESVQAFTPLLVDAAETGHWTAGLVWRAAMLPYMRGDFRAALDLLDRAPEPPAVPTADDASVLACRATTLHLLGESDAAAATAARALSAAGTAGDDRARAFAHIAAAMIAIGVRREEHLAEALAAAERAGDVVQQARVLANQADCLLRAARYPQALRASARAVRTAEAGAPPGVLVTALHNAGEALTRLGRYEEATLHCERSIQISHRAGLRRTAPGLYGLGEINRQLGRPEQSRVAFEEAIELARGHREPQVLVPALAGLARLLADGGDVPAALAAAAEAEQAAPPGLAAAALLAA
ncbi:tetratricopeptide repeat protein, partial [Phytohabitans rumicis]|uniref:tetratricopeptide repeat protein n=1 Tax=Phytohabitans rumicis TaxID=1076125 RepID=UPI0031E613D1